MTMAADYQLAPDAARQSCLNSWLHRRGAGEAGRSAAGAFRCLCRQMSMRTRTIAVCLALLSAGCSHTDGQKAPADNWAILDPPGTQATSWHLEESTVPEMLSGAKAYLERESVTSTNDSDRGNVTGILSRWDSYSCQIFPSIDGPDTRKVAVLRFFPSSEGSNNFKNWRSEPVRVKGGGYGFWTVSYDPEKREYSRFGVNASE
jgi:hypothetical protein